MADELPIGPPWLFHHILEHDPDIHDIYATEHACEECIDFLELFQNPINSELPENKLVRNCPTTGPATDINLFDFKLQNDLWITPNYMKECGFWPDGVSEEAIRCGIAYASEMMYVASGRQYKGVCERVLMPGCVKGSSWNGKYRNGTFCHDYRSDPNYKFPTCVESGCEGDELRIPGPIQAVGEIIIDGEILDPSKYAIKNNRSLIRLDGEKWPATNNLTKSPYVGFKQKVYEGTAEEDTESNWIQEWKDDYGLKEPVRGDVDISGIVNADSMSDWALDFLSLYPQSLPERRKEWIEEWLNEKGLTPCKVNGGVFTKGFDRVKFVLSPKESRILVDELSKGCEWCRSKIDLTEACPRCGSIDMVVYVPEINTNSQIPDWIKEWSVTNRFEIQGDKSSAWYVQEAEKLGLPHLCDPLEDISHLLSEPCYNQCEPEKIDLSYLNYSTYQVAGMRQVETCCLDRETKVMEVILPCLNACNDNHEFATALELIHTIEPPKITEAQKEHILHQPIEGAPNWLNREMGWQETPEIVKEVSYEELCGITDWAKDYINGDSNKTASKHFAQWVERNLDTQIAEREEEFKASTSAVYVPNKVKKAVQYDKPTGPSDNPSWAIRYYQGTGEIPHMAKVAAATVAKDIAQSLCAGSSCFIPRSLSRLVLDQSADFRWPDLSRALEKGMTGIPEVDYFLKTINPKGLNRSGYAFHPCIMPKRQHHRIDRTNGRKGKW